MKKLLAFLLLAFSLSLFVPEVTAAPGKAGTKSAAKAHKKKKHRQRRHKRNRKHHKKHAMQTTALAARMA